MKTTWTLQDAKNRFSEVVEEALRHGPQTITRHGKETAVLISAETYRVWSGQQENLVDFFQHSPLHALDLDLERSRDMGRTIHL